MLDPFGRRVARKKNGTVTHRFLWGSALGPIAEVDASSNVVTRYVYGTRANVPDFMVKGSQVLRLVTDLRGSVRLVVDVATGAVMQHIEYDEWGKQTLNSSPGLQPFGFSGGLSDEETGLVRFGARDYDPEVGRWVTKDPIGFDGGMNVYVYAANDPVNFVDATGKKIIYTNATARDHELLHHALAYLGPKGFSHMVMLELSPQHYRFEFLHGEGGGSEFDPNNGRLGWNPLWAEEYDTTELSDAGASGTCQSPALTLFHELVHAKDNQLFGFSADTEWPGPRVPEFKNYYEFLAVGESNKLASELGEPERRSYPSEPGGPKGYLVGAPHIHP